MVKRRQTHVLSFNLKGGHIWDYSRCGVQGLNAVKGVKQGIVHGSVVGIIKGDTKSLAHMVDPICRV